MWAEYYSHIGYGVLLAAGTALLLVLYRNGLISINAWAAIMFAGHDRRDGSRASFRACSGYIKRRVRPKEEREYTFTVEAAIQKGEVEAILTDGAGRTLLCLNSSNTEGKALLSPYERYGLKIAFKKASGKYEISWR